MPLATCLFSKTLQKRKLQPRYGVGAHTPYRSGLSLVRRESPLCCVLLHFLSRICGVSQCKRALSSPRCNKALVGIPFHSADLGTREEQCRLVGFRLGTFRRSASAPRTRSIMSMSRRCYWTGAPLPGARGVRKSHMQAMARFAPGAWNVIAR